MLTPKLITHEYAPPTDSEKASKIFNQFPAFAQALHKHFPSAIPLNDYMVGTSKALKPFGFKNENTMGMVAVCRDELTDPFFEQVVAHWGKTFNCCSLAGFIIMGRTGLEAATAHTPIYDGIRRFTFFAMPHIAISRYGEVGLLYRRGIANPSHACGSLEKIIQELQSGHLNLEMDMQDLEQSIIRQKLLSSMSYGDIPDGVKHIQEFGTETDYNDLK